MKTLRKTVMAVDDSITNLKYIEHILKNGFNIILKKSGSEAIEELNRMRDKPDLIMLDVNMPGMDGFETYKKIRENNANARIPVVFLTGETDSETEENGLELGADDFIIKPVDPITLQYRISRILEYDAMKKSLEQKLLDKEIESEKLMFQLIITISNTIDSRSGFMRYNSILVAQYAEEVAKRLGMNSEDIRKIKYMGLLHDIGMIVVPTTIISKPGKLTEEEYDEVKRHTLIGGKMLSAMTSIDGVSAVARFHHERYDGKGYPEGLIGDDIPIMARIVSACDAFVAMNSDRPYRKKLSMDEIREELVRESSGQFDPKIVSVLLKMIDDEVFFDEGTFRTKIKNTYKSAEEKLLSDFIFQYTRGIEQSFKKDALTGLWDRNYMEEAVNEHLEIHNNGAFLMLDMDNFKYINDTFGHIAGDSLLIRFSSALNSMIRADDIVSRVGGDEFAIFLKSTFSREDCENKVSRIFEKLETVFRDISSINSDVSVSIGIAMAPNDGTDFMTLYKNADSALYHVKKSGKSNFYFFDSNVKQKTVENLDEKTRATIDDVQNLINTQDSAPGAFEVEYNAFQDIYHFIKRSKERKENSVQLLLFTVITSDDSGLSPDESIAVMDILKDSIRLSLRRGDVTNHFSGMQYVVLLMACSKENGDIIAGRIKSNFLEAIDEKGYEGIELAFEISEVDAV